MKARLIIVILFLVPAASGTVLINSQNWQEIGKGINYAQITDQEFMVLNTPGEARVAESTVNSPVKLLQGQKRTVSNLNSTGLEVKRTLNIQDLTYFNKTEGYIVVRPKFGTDMVSALPYAAKKDLAVLFWNSENQQLIEETSKRVVFYGNYDFDPSERFGAAYISGDLRKRTFEIVEKMGSSWVILSPRENFNPEAIQRGRPVVFQGSSSETVEAIDNSSVEKIQVIGGSNMLYAKQLDLMSQKDLGIIAKLGRAFTGIKDLSGVTDVKKVDMPYRTYNLRVGGLKTIMNASKVRLDIINQGSTERKANIVLRAGKDQRKTSIHIPSYTTVSWTTNISSKEVDVSVESQEYNYQETFRNLTEVDQERYDLELSSWNYSDKYNNLSLDFANREDKRLWIMVQTDDRSQREGLKPGESKEIDLEFIEERPSNITVFQGEYRNRMSYSEVISLREQETTNLGVVALLIFVLLLTFSAFLFIWKGDTLSVLGRDIWRRLRRLVRQ